MKSKIIELLSKPKINADRQTLAIIDQSANTTTSNAEVFICNLVQLLTTTIGWTTVQSHQHCVLPVLRHVSWPKWHLFHQYVVGLCDVHHLHNIIAFRNQCFTTKAGPLMHFGYLKNSSEI